MKVSASTVEQAFARYTQMTDAEKTEFKAMVQGFEFKTATAEPAAAPKPRKQRTTKETKNDPEVAKGATA